MANGQWIPVDDKWHYVEMIIVDGRPVVKLVDGISIPEVIEAPQPPQEPSPGIPEDYWETAG